jgi:hypothetical protein
MNQAKRNTLAEMPSPKPVQLPQPMPFDEALRRLMTLEPKPAKKRKRISPIGKKDDDG